MTGPRDHGPPAWLGCILFILIAVIAVLVVGGILALGALF